MPTWDTRSAKNTIEEALTTKSTKNAVTKPSNNHYVAADLIDDILYKYKCCSPKHSWNILEKENQ